MECEGVLIKYFSAQIKRKLTLKVECSEPAYWEFFNDNLMWLEENETGCRIACNIKTTISKVPAINNSFVSSVIQGYNRLGYNLYIKESSVVCIYGGWLLWKYEVDKEGKININIYYTTQDDNCLIKLARRILRGISPVQINREKFLFITRIGIHFPIFLFLRTNENIEIMHAAAVEKDGEAVVLVGYDGVGKSTLAMYLCLKNNFQYVADNFLLYDEKCIYPFVESARLSEDSVKQLGLPSTGKRIHGRVEVLPQLYTSRLSLNVSAIFFNYISGEDFPLKIEKIDKKKLKNRILTMEDYLPEFIDYKQFVSVVRLTEGLEFSQCKEFVLDRFLENKRLYNLRKYRINDIDELAERIKRLI
jgi:ABC-type cobalamin/Fe3+-siderophores transport system ATPase subunit